MWWALHLQERPKTALWHNLVHSLPLVSPPLLEVMCPLSNLCQISCDYFMKWTQQKMLWFCPFFQQKLWKLSSMFKTVIKLNKLVLEVFHALLSLRKDMIAKQDRYCGSEHKITYHTHQINSSSWGICCWKKRSIWETRPTPPGFNACKEPKKIL